MQTAEELGRMLAADVAAGRLGPGDLLPPVRVLAGERGCAAGTVARAYLRLRDAGVVAGASAQPCGSPTTVRSGPEGCCGVMRRCG